MEFKIQETEAGQFEIIQTQPVVIGSFPDREVARKVMSFLVEDAMENLAADTSASPVSVLAEPVPVPKTNPAPASAQPDEWTEVELEEAFARRQAGEGLKSISESFGKNMRKLQGKWAQHLRHNKSEAIQSGQSKSTNQRMPAKAGDAAPPLAKVTQAITELNDQAECRLCGRHFEQSPDQLDLCARCTNAT